ncbi:hypothetical protein CsatA_026619 [Cannabis sativa]
MKLTIGEGRDEIKFFDGVVLIFPEMVKYRYILRWSTSKIYFWFFVYQYQRS